MISNTSRLHYSWAEAHESLSNDFQGLFTVRKDPNILLFMLERKDGQQLENEQLPCGPGEFQIAADFTRENAHREAHARFIIARNSHSCGLLFVRKFSSLFLATPDVWDPGQMLSSKDHANTIDSYSTPMLTVAYNW